MDERQKMTLLKETFDTVSGGYDDKALRFFSNSAQNLASILKLRGGEHVLDVACGTGHASLAMAGMLPNGRVTSTDFSPGMLSQARRKAKERNITNIEFIEMDMQRLEFPDNSFDAAVCAFGIFFVEDMETQLAHIASKVRPDGEIAITSFQENYFSPLKELFYGRLAAFGVQSPPQTWKRIAHEDACRDLFAKAGLNRIDVEARNVGYYLNSAEDWWSIVWNAGLRRMVNQLPEQDRKKFKHEHLQEVDARRTGEGIWLDVGVLYTIGAKPRL